MTHDVIKKVQCNYEYTYICGLTSHLPKQPATSQPVINGFEKSRLIPGNKKTLMHNESSSHTVRVKRDTACHRQSE